MAKPSSAVRRPPAAAASPLTHSPATAKKLLKKAPSGIDGFDEITTGGLPRGRPTLVYGGPGCGKTLLGLQFLTIGAEKYGEPGVFLAFEETVDDLKRNVRSLGFDLADLMSRQLLTIEHARIEPAREIGQGDYDLDALFMRLARAIDTAQAKRIVIDSLGVLLHHEPDRAAIRDAFHRLFRWLANRGVTSVVTAEEGENGHSRHGFEEYIADCVVHLDHRIRSQLSTRTLRVVKYRGSSHGTNEYPFLIDEGGVHVLPVTSIGLDHTVTSERVSSGIARLDHMLGGAGFYRGTTVLVSGTPGSGKSSLAAHYITAACARGERVLAFTYEESPDQVIRNMASIGLDLRRWVDDGLLRFIAARPSMYGLEMHLAVMLKAIDSFAPHSVIIDPISNLVRAGTGTDAQTVVVRLLDLLKTRGITAILTHPTNDAEHVGRTDLAVSSIIDSWILMQTLPTGGERNRTLYILKSRGMAHSNQIREFLMTSTGISLVDVYTGPDGVLTGAARAAREAQSRAEAMLRERQIAQRERAKARRRKTIEAQIATLQEQLSEDESETGLDIAEAKAVVAQLEKDRSAMAKRRRADADPSLD